MKSPASTDEGRILGVLHRLLCQSSACPLARFFILGFLVDFGTRNAFSAPESEGDGGRGSRDKEVRTNCPRLYTYYTYKRVYLQMSVRKR